VRSVGIVPHRDRGLARELAVRVALWLGERDVEVFLGREDAELVGLPHLAAGAERFARPADLVLALGGDGTMLHTVQLVYPAPTPILGVNVGQLGYMSALEPAELEPELPRLLAGELTISERMVLELTVSSAGAAGGTWHALNEAVLEKVGGGHLVRVEVEVDQSPFTTYAADGLIVSTPTGSTAYSFSARGPIASPELRCMLLTPVSPHMLFDRSLVLGPDEEVALTVADARTAMLTVDGREVGELAPGDRVECRAAAAPARIVARPGHDFHRILKSKFRLPDR
jgi:NAD+ kinase